MLSGLSLRSAFLFSFNSLILCGFLMRSFHLAESILVTRAINDFSCLYIPVCAVAQKYYAMLFIYNYLHY